MINEQPLLSVHNVFRLLTTVQHVRAALHQLHQRTSPAVLQPSHVRFGAGGIQEGRHPVGIHRFRHGLADVYRPY